MQNYFELLDLTPAYSQDEAALQRAYVSAQQRYHPDRLVGKSEAERAEAIHKSMDASEAYEQLKSPLGRAEHLLALQGIIVNADEADTHKPSQGLLMEMLEMRETLAEAGNEVDIAKHAQDIKAAMRTCEKKLGEYFEAHVYAEAAQQTIRLRYLGKALEEALGYQYRLKSPA